MIMEKLGTQVLLIRGSLFLLQILTTYFIPPYDTSTSETYQTSDLPLDGIASLGHGNWDAVYYNHLARHGYDYESFGAFFPLYPALLAVLGSCLYLPLQLLMSYDSCLILTSFLLNNSLFYLNTMLVRKLAKLYGLSDAHAYQAALLYALNPASIFMSVGYTESLFSLFVLLGLIIREADSQWYFVFFCLATGVRSNGLSLLLFILYDHITSMVKAKQFLVVNCIVMVVQVCACIAPFAMFQNHMFAVYCADQENVSEWCDVGISYSYIQTHYWGVGLFKYWELKQLPNFLLASPMFALVGVIVLSWAYEQYLNLTDLHTNYLFLNSSFQLVGYLHLVALTALALVSMHVQVVTRFIVANCPFLFVYSAKLDRRISRVVLCYFVVYCVVGTVLHSTFYPWT